MKGNAPSARARIKAAIKANPEKSNNAIAKAIGVSREYVGRVRRQSAASDGPIEAKGDKRQWPFTLPATEAVTRLTRLFGFPKLAMQQLCRDIRSKGRNRLPAAIRCIRDGSETFERLRPSELESFDVESLLEANAADFGYGGIIDDGEYGGPEEQSAHATERWLFVDPARFEKLHPEAATPETAASASANNTLPPRRKPGRKFRDDWPIRLGAWLIEVASDAPKRLRNVNALLAEAETVLKEEFDNWAPPEKQLRTMIETFLLGVPR